MRIVALILAAALAVHAQSVTSEIRVQVRDSTGGALEAAGTLEGLATAVHRVFRTDADGRHTLTRLPLGIYRLHLTRDGFEAQSVRVELRSETPAEQPVTLSVAGVRTTVDVREEDTLLN